MKIFYVGNFREPFCTEVHIANTLERLGHEVIRVQEDGGRFDELIQQDFDMFLFTRTWGETVKMEHLDQLKKRKIPSVSYHLDLYVGLQREDGLESDPFWRTDYVFTPDGDPKSAEVFKKKGINHYWMKPGVDKAECVLSPHLAWKHDVIFVGSTNYHPEYPYRGQLLNWLSETYGDRYGKYGHPEQTIRNKPLNQLFANTKVVVGDSLILPGHVNYWSDRPYETLGRGGFLIMPYVPGMDYEFIDGVHMAFYEHGNFKELKAKIDYFIRKDDIREDIRKIGHQFVKEKATYDNRLTEMLELTRGKIKMGKS